MAGEGIADSVASWIASQSTALTRGVNVVTHALPEPAGHPDLSTSLPMLAVFESPGLAPVNRFVPSSGGQSAFTVHRLRVLVRSTQDDNGEPDPRPSRQIATDAYRSAVGYPPNTTGAYPGGRLTLAAEGAVQSFGRDQQGRYLWEFTVVAHAAST